MTKKFGIIGNPIKHSLSPILHNYWFKKYNIDADYEIIEAVDKELPEIINKVKKGDYIGINVTLPFKQKIIKILLAALFHTMDILKTLAAFIKEKYILIMKIIN